MTINIIYVNKPLHEVSLQPDCLTMYNRRIKTRLVTN